MRLKISHRTVYGFDAPAAAVIQTLRLTPRGHDGQHVVNWRLDVDRNCRLRTAEDAFGNHTHIFAVDGPIDALTVLVEGEIDTQDTGGVVRGAVERFPPALYLRETDLTTPDLEIAAFARDVAACETETLGKLHALLAALHDRMDFEVGPTDSATTASQAFKMERGVCQDLTHVFLAAARKIGVPARYVGGYLWKDPAADGETAGQSIDGSGMVQTMGGMSQTLGSAAVEEEQHAGHAWAEAYVAGFGWVGFDCANCLCPTEAYVRVAIGLDYLGAAPVRGARYGGVGETLDVSVAVEDASARRAFRRA